MARARLYILLLSLCVISSACAKKAKMRAVPRQTPAATGVQAAPQLPPPADEVPAEPTPRTPEVATAPAPAPATPVTRLDDGDETRRVVRPAPAPRREIPRGDGELNRPAPRVREERRERRVVETDDCPPMPAPRERQVVAPAPRPRPQPRPRVEQQMEQRQQFELDARDVLHCRWEPTAKPMTYLVYNPVNKTASVQHGWPQKWNHYANVRLVTGLPPYGEEGLSLVTKTGVPIAHLKPSSNGTIWYERNTAYPYESYFGQVPGAPQGEAIRGVCWTKSEPAKTTDAGF